MPKTDKPNILVIWGDDIGIANLSCYSHGLMGYQTPNIDRLAKEGMMFTDSYGEQILHGGPLVLHHRPERLSHRPLQGRHSGRADRHEREDSSPSPPASRTRATPPASSARTISAISTQCCRPITASTSSSAISITSTPRKSRNMADYPNEKDFPNFRKTFGPRGVMHSLATDKDDPTVEPRWGKVGKQKIEDTGPLTKKRMETCDDDFVARAKEFMKKANDAGKPFFVWLNTTHMHLFTHTKPESIGQAGRWQSPYHDTMIDHDKNVGQVLDYLDELGIADNTFVMYSTDNGPHMNSWPDGAMTPFRSEKNTNWEGAFRVPLLVRWPGKIKPGQISNEIVQHHDWLPTFLAMAGDPDVIEKLKKGYQAIGRTYKNHIDGYNLLPYLTGQEKESPRKFFMYLSDDGDVLGIALRQLEGRVHGAALPRHAAGLGGAVHAGSGCRRSSIFAPILLNARIITSNTYYDWFFHHVYMMYGAQAVASQWAATFKDFPPIQKPNTFTIDDALKAMHETAAGMH